MKLRISDGLWGLAFLFAAYLMWGEADRDALQNAMGMALSLGTVMPALIALWWLDRLPPTPVRTWWRSLGFGLFIISIVATYVHLYVGVTVTETAVESEAFAPDTAENLGDLAGTLLSAPIFEESFKGLLPFLMLLASVDHSGLKRHEVGPWPALLTGLLVCLGFGSAENATHFVRNFADWQGRLFFAYLHAAFSLPMLLAIGFAALLPTLSSRIALSLGGWLVSVALHGLWNADVLFEGTQWSLGPWIRHAPTFSPALCGLCVGFVYWWERRALHRSGVDLRPLSKPPRSGETSTILAAREQILSRPLTSV